MDRLCYKLSVRSHHKTSHFGINRNVSHSGRNQNFFINLTHPLTDHADVIRCLIRLVRDSDTTGKVDEFNICSGLLFEAYGQLKQLTRKLRIVFIRYRIACQKSMHTEIPDTLFPSKMRYPSNICSVVNPYLESPGLSMIPLLSSKKFHRD